MAQQMQQANPELVEQLRQQFSGAPADQRETGLDDNSEQKVENEEQTPKEKSPTVEEIEKASTLKEEGNDFVKSGKYHEAIEKYNDAIKLNPTPAYFCNRAAAFCRLEKYDSAIEVCFFYLYF